MKSYKYLLLSNYNKKLKLDKDMFYCYSKRKLNKLYEAGGYHIVGEAKKKKLAPDDELLVVGNEKYSVKSVGTYNKLVYKKSGFVCVGNDDYVVILKNRIPFLLLLVALMAGILLALYILFRIMNGSELPTDGPAHPLPNEDSNMEEIKGDTSEKVTVNDGGGSVSMIYSLKAVAHLEDQSIDILFQNPAASNHDVVLELYVKSGEERVLVATSGRVVAGYGLYKMYIDTEKVTLSTGDYDGVYKVIYYNPTTGERALVESEITDVTLTVK